MRQRSEMELGTQKEAGFSLIELLIAVAIILRIAAIAIPNLLRARVAANESSATGILRTLNTAELNYLLSYPTAGYAADLKSLGGSGPCTPSASSACLIDNSLATTGNSPGEAGYKFNAVATGPTPYTQYLVTAVPITQHLTGQSSFCSVEDNVLRKDTTGALPATHDACQGLPALGN